METIVGKLKPENVRRTPELFEIKIYQFIIQLVKEDMNKKYVVGQKMFKDVYQARLRLITSENTHADQAIVLYSNGTGNPGELERNFFKLLHFLSKNCPKNNEGIKSIKQGLENYVDLIKTESNLQARQEVVKKIDAIIKDAMF